MNNNYLIDPRVLDALSAKQKSSGAELTKALLQALFNPREFALFSSSEKKGRNSVKKPKLHPFRRNAIIGKFLEVKRAK